MLLNIYTEEKLMETLVPEVMTKVKEFYEKYGEDMQDCNPNALELLESVVKKGDFVLLDDFIYYYLEEIEACHDNAIDLLLEICNDAEIKV